MSSDPINPKHYKHLPAEAIDIIEAAIAKAPSNQSAYLHGQVLKYLLRCWSKNGVEDLQKAKWYLDRMVASFDEVLAEASGAIKPSKTQPPSDYRLLGDAKDEPRTEGDQYWSLAIRRWTVLTSHKVEYANEHNWLACRKIETPSDPPKRYRDPTQADLANGPIDCEVRDWDREQWKARRLIQVHEFGPFRFRCKNETSDNPLNWNQCRIKVAE